MCCDVTFNFFSKSFTHPKKHSLYVTMTINALILFNVGGEIFSQAHVFHAQLAFFWNTRCQVTFADYAPNHPFLKSVVHKLSSDIQFVMVLTKSLIVTVVSKTYIFFK